MSIKIIKQGVQATLQDTGREGFRSAGIGTGGAADIFAMKAADFLVGNDAGSAVLEINFPAPEILFQYDAIISITGANLDACVNDKPLPLWKPVLIKQDDLLRFKQPVTGSKAYLAVQGGFRSEKWLGSYSTHLKVAAGGHLGRALQKDDVIDFNDYNFSLTHNKILSWQISGLELDKIYEPKNIVRCLKSIEWNRLSASAKNEFENNIFSITNQSDRMGYRLQGKTILSEDTAEIISSPVDAGTIQLLPGGSLIVLMADHQSTGGYPRIASVIKADLPKMAQLNPGQSVSFKLVTMQQAEDALLVMQQTLVELKISCQLNFEKYFKQ
jgi:antagonist of KipI